MKRKSESKLGRALATLKVAKGSIALAWLGQAGFVIKTPGGVRVALDPYLSNSCEAIGKKEGLNMRRKRPTPIFAEELVAFDAILFTHSHQDHVDPDTVIPYIKAGGHGLHVAPHEAADRLRSLGVPAEEIALTWPNHAQQIGDLTIRATFAIPFAGDDLTHIGYLIEVKGGPRIYFTGDTDYNDILGISVAPYQPDIMASVINPAFRNLSPRQAADLAKVIQPRLVIPCHHDLFPDNSLPAELLRTNLIIQGMPDLYHPVKYGVIETFAGFKSVKNRKSLL